MPKSFLVFVMSNWKTKISLQTSIDRYCKYIRLTRKINPIGPIQTMIEKPVSKLIPDIPRVMKLRHLRNIITRRYNIEIFRV